MELKGRSESKSDQLNPPVTVDIMTTALANNFPSKNKTEKFTEKMSRKTKLSESEIDRLVQIFKRITVW